MPAFKQRSWVRRVIPGAAGMVLVLGSGCSRLDFSREVFHNPFTDVMDSGRPYVVDKGGDSDQRKAKFDTVLAQWQESRLGQSRGDYVLGPGDILKVSIFAIEAPDRTSDFARTIGKDGTIALPWIDPIPAAGLSARGLEEAIKSIYRDKYLKNPQVTVAVEGYRSAAVIMTGAVVNPGVYYLQEVSSTVLEMIAMAGGLSDEAAGEIMVVRQDEAAPRPRTLSLKDGIKPAAGEASAAEAQHAIPIDLSALVDAGDLRQNVEIQAGDILSVRSSKRQYIYVIGYVSRPGAFELRGGQKIDALRAVAMAGGLSTLGRAENASLLRQENDRQTVVEVDLIKMARGVRPLVNLQPGDTLIVGTSFIGRASEIVRPTVSAGMNYSPVTP